MLTASKQLRDQKGRFGPKAQATSFVEWLKLIKAEMGIEFDYNLAKKLGMSADRISRIIAGKYAPSTPELQNIFNNLNIKESSQEYYLLLELAHKCRLGLAEK